MYTTRTNVAQNYYNLRNPTKQTKSSPVPIISNFALILLYVYQDMKKNKSCEYIKKELVGDALGHIDQKYVLWNWSSSAFGREFDAFSFNNLIKYDKIKKRWYPTNQLVEYIDYHFGPYTKIPLTSALYPFKEAITYNENANIQKQKNIVLYRKKKEVMNKFFF
jgi:hypothetical protein